MMMKYGEKVAKSNFMLEAIDESLQSGKDIPVGCVIISSGNVISKTHNMREKNNDITAHAEILAIQDAQRKLKSSRLINCDMYVTLEPCPMCAWAILQSGIKNLYFGAYNLQYGAVVSNFNFLQVAHSKLKVYGGIEEDKCNNILEEFFKKLR